MTHRRIVAIVAAVVGAAMLAWPDDYPPERFATAFTFASTLVPWLDPRTTWGLALVTVGLLKLLWLRPVFAALLACAIGTWVLCVIYGIVHAWIGGEQTPTSPAGWVWIAAGLWHLVLPDIAPRRRRWTR